MSSGVDCTLSVIIPSYNRSRYLSDAIASVFEQGVSDVQVIVVDDGSTDNTKQVVNRYGGRVEYLYQDNRGTAYARNRGLAEARGHYISFLDSDDVWLPGKFEAELDALRRIPEADAVISDCESWRQGKLICNSWFEDQGVKLDPNGVELLSRLPPLWIKSKLFATCCLTVKRVVLERMGRELFDTSLVTHEDWDFSIRLILTFDVVVLPRICARVRRFEDGTRIGRPLPGTQYPPSVKRVMEYRRYRVLERAQRLGLPAHVLERVEEYRAEASRNVAENYRGWRRPNLGNLVSSELWRGARGNAAALLVLSLLPARLRPQFRALIENGKARQQSAPARARI
jgi:glycosyltransferase involved in cell wall biosynthesis